MGREDEFFPSEAARFRMGRKERRNQSWDGEVGDGVIQKQGGMEDDDEQGALSAAGAFGRSDEGMRLTGAQVRENNTQSCYRGHNESSQPKNPLPNGSFKDEAARSSADYVRVSIHQVPRMFACMPRACRMNVACVCFHGRFIMRAWQRDMHLCFNLIAFPKTCVDL
jgi:hypothetical protein